AADATGFRRDGRAHRAAGRRALHRPHHPRGDQRTVRLWPTGRRAAGRAGRPRRARAADPARLRGGARGAAAGAFAGARARCRRPVQLPGGNGNQELAMLYKRNPQLNKHGELVHLLSVEGLPRETLTHILDTASSFVSVSDREVKKVPLLRGKSVFNLFFENSTRTRTTFEIAATRLSADV